jgi:hypothetical protein
MAATANFDGWERGASTMSKARHYAVKAHTEWSMLMSASDSDKDYVFLTNSWHQPLGLMSPSTNLHAFGGWKLTQSSQRWSPFGVA